MKREVLVFNGPGICPLSRDGLVDSLETALASHYWVGTIDHEGLRTKDWTESCALLVFPHCTHPQPYDALDVDRQTISRIRDFVYDGGSFLGVCGGAYFASETARWFGHQWGSTNLAFWPGISKGPFLDEGAQTHEFTLPFLMGQYETEELTAKNVTQCCDLHCDGGGAFICEDDSGSIPFTIMGSYSPDRYAGVKCTIGAGRVVLWHARLERSFRDRDVERGFHRTYGSRQYNIEKLERRRFRVLRHTLRHLNLQPEPEVMLQPLPKPPLQYLLSTPHSQQRPQNPFAHLQTCEVSDEYEDFEFQPLSWVVAPDWTERSVHQSEKTTRQRRTWIICPEELPHQWPQTPHFNFPSYFELLEDARGHRRLDTPLGDSVLYGETVTSTQTQLTLNPKMANLLPCPLLSLATFQLQGFGWNYRPWLSPYEVLQWSLLLELPPHLEHLTQNLDPFIHLLGLTVVETCRDVSNAGSTIVLKWPNGIYANVDDRLEKIGGIVVNNISGSSNRILMGCGLNVRRNEPVCSLSRFATTELSVERVLANVMTALSVNWDEFLRASGSFSGFEQRYRRVWLHSGWRGLIRRRGGEEMKCTLLGIDEPGRLQVQVSEQDGGRPREITISADRFDLDIQQSIIYQIVF